jgi:hypothetical protein
MYVYRLVEVLEWKFAGSGKKERVALLGLLSRVAKSAFEWRMSRAVK